MNRGKDTKGKTRGKTKLNPIVSKSSSRQTRKAYLYTRLSSHRKASLVTTRTPISINKPLVGRTSHIEYTSSLPREELVISKIETNTTKALEEVGGNFPLQIEESSRPHFGDNFEGEEVTQEEVVTLDPWYTGSIPPRTTRSIHFTHMFNLVYEGPPTIPSQQAIVDTLYKEIYREETINTLEGTTCPSTTSMGDHDQHDQGSIHGEEEYDKATFRFPILDTTPNVAMKISLHLFYPIFMG